MLPPHDLGILSHLDATRAALGPVEGLALLDIGCGESSLPRDLARLGAQCTGIDPFMAARDWETEGQGGWRILRASAEALPQDDASIDGILFIYALHHVPGAALAAALREARRVLKPAGRLYVAEPLARGDFNDLIKTFHDEGNVRAETQRALEGARPLFDRHAASGYVSRHHYDRFEAFATMMTAGTRFNDYAAADVAAPAVRARFDTIAARTGGIFDQPVKVDVYG